MSNLFLAKSVTISVVAEGNKILNRYPTSEYYSIV